MKLITLRTALLALAPLLLSACGGGGGGGGAGQTAGSQSAAIVVTAAADFSVGAHSVISIDAPRSVSNQLLPTASSDLAVSTDGSHFYRIERFFGDNISKLECAAPEIPLWQYRTMDDVDEAEGVTSSNPYQLVVVDENRGYLIRYGAATVWIVNPSATSESEFKIGSLDLSHYDESDGVPEAVAAALVGDQLFIAMQRQDTVTDPLQWDPQAGYVAVIDIDDDNEIVTGQGGALPGIELPIRNLAGIQYVASEQRLYVHATGRLFPQEFTGGVVAIDPDDYRVELLLDDGDADDHPWGQINGLAVLSSQQAYFLGYQAWTQISLFRFNPTSGVVQSEPVATLADQDLRTLALDGSGRLWVGRADLESPEVIVIDTADDSIEERLGTELNPLAIGFCSES